MDNPRFFDFSSFFEDEKVRAGITAKHFPYVSPDDRHELAKLLGLPEGKMVIPRQTHTNRVEIARTPGVLPETDGIVTNRKGLVLSIQVADCVPVFIYDPTNRIVGLIHAGWRGVVDGIVRNSMRTVEKLGGNPADCRVVLGPSIQKCCFQIGPEIAGRFEDQFVRREEGKIFVDLQKLIAGEFVAAGVRETRILSTGQCTKCLPDVFHSYRRDGEQAGRMVAVLGLL